MILMLFLVPFLLLFFSSLVLFSATRGLKEKLTIFLFNPENSDKGSSDTIVVLRIIFWISLFLSIWITMGVILRRG